MQRVSSSATLFLKFFVPTFWIVFFGAFSILMLLTSPTINGKVSPGVLRIGAVLFFLLGIAVLYWAVMRLKRVEMDKDFIYATNYFKTFRYPYHNVEKMVENDYLFFRSIHIFLKEPGTFGPKITFVVSQKLLERFLEDHPEVRVKLV